MEIKHTLLKCRLQGEKLGSAHKNSPHRHKSTAEHQIIPRDTIRLGARALVVYINSH